MRASLSAFGRTRRRRFPYPSGVFGPMLRVMLVALGLVVPGILAAAEPDRAEIEKIVREYLLANPEIVQDALIALESRRRAAESEALERLLADRDGPLYASPNHLVWGNPKGDVTIVEFFDFNCGYCKRGLADLQKLLAEDSNIRLILKDFPILSPGSQEAAKVSIALRKQLPPERSWQFHVGLLEQRGPVGRAEALALAKTLGADIARLEAGMASPATQAAIEETLDLADQMGITGTPTYVIGNELMIGARGIDLMRERIANVRACGRSSC